MLLGSFVEADRILCGLEYGVNRDELIRYFGRDAIERIETLIVLSQPMRQAPYGVKTSIDVITQNGMGEAQCTSNT